MIYKKPLFLLIIFIISSTYACSGFSTTKKKKNLISYQSISEDSDNLDRVVKKIRPAVVTLLRKRKMELGPHSMELESFVSGVLISDDGYIVTNYHNIKKRKISTISVELLEKPGRYYAPQIIKTDPVLDLTLLKIERKKPFPYVSINTNNTELRIGDTVLAIGTSHVVKRYSGVVQKGTIIKNSNYLFTDAKVSKGYSGGGLFNTTGKLIAIPTKLHKTAHISTSIKAEQILAFLSKTPLSNTLLKKSNTKPKKLTKISHEINNIAKKNISLVVQVTAEPTDEDFKRKMMKVSKIMKINLYRTGKNMYKYWHPASGIIISEDGYILTAYFQVVDNCKKLTVTIFNKDGSKTTYPAKLISHIDDYNTNLALLKVESKEKLPFTTKEQWEIIKPKIGHLVFTFGNHKYFEQSFTGGIISNFHEGLIQTDAAINDGNLGAPLINDRGKFIGIVIKREFNLNGVSLAVPADKVLNFLDEYFNKI